MATVLIVDDDSDFRKQVCALFDHGGGFDAFVEARNGADALNQTKQLSPDLAVLDFCLQDMDVLELAQRLKALIPKLPIFVVTTDYNVSLEKKALASGINAVFSKLDDLATLVANGRAVCGIE
jgi:two-component system response regulator EvgA